MALIVDLGDAIPTDSWIFRLLTGLCIPIALIFFISKITKDPRRKRLPPGPPGHWLWRNTFDLDGKSGDNRYDTVRVVY